jgi:hypothetical protein
MALPGGYQYTGTQTWRRPRDEEAALDDLAQRGYVARDPIEEEHLLTNYDNIVRGPSAIHIPGVTTPAAWMTEADKRLTEKWAAQDIAEEMARQAAVETELKKAEAERRRAQSIRWRGGVGDTGTFFPGARQRTPTREGMPMEESWARRRLPGQYRYTPSPGVTYGAPEERESYFRIPGVEGYYQRNPKTGAISQIKGTGPGKKPKTLSIQLKDYQNASKMFMQSMAQLNNPEWSMQALPEEVETVKNQARNAITTINQIRASQGLGPLPGTEAFGASEGQEGPGNYPGAGMYSDPMAGMTNDREDMTPAPARGSLPQARPRIFRHPKTGKRIYHNGVNWVDVQTGRPYQGR